MLWKPLGLVASGLEDLPTEQDPDVAQKLDFQDLAIA